MIIPASTNERHELRFRNFSVEFTGLLRIANGYDAITVTRDRKSTRDSITRTRPTISILPEPPSVAATSCCSTIC